jgi:hypothetical protein
MKAQYNGSFNIKRKSQSESPTYILNDKNYLLILWMMTPLQRREIIQSLNYCLMKNKKNITTKCGCISLLSVQWTSEFTQNQVKTFCVQGHFFGSERSFCH